MGCCSSDRIIEKINNNDLLVRTLTILGFHNINTDELERVFYPYLKSKMINEPDLVECLEQLKIDYINTKDFFKYFSPPAKKKDNKIEKNLTFFN